MKKILFISLAIASIFLSPSLSLFAGIVTTLILSPQFERQVSRISSYLLKIAVVGLGFGMNIKESLAASSEGIVFTIFSVTLVMVTGVLIGKRLKVARPLAYLISSGTAICGGSAIAAIAPVVKSKPDDTSMSLAVVFTLNAVAMFVFPIIGSLLELTQEQFGMWSAIAIHDTSAVVGAAKTYGSEALKIATTIKLTRALWIIPLSIVSTFIFKSGKEGRNKISIPWFILLYVVAMVINTYFPLEQTLSTIIEVTSHKILSITLFLIGSMLSRGAIKRACIKPIAMGIILWVLISVVALIAVIWF